MKALFTVPSLLLSTALLMIGHGLQLTLLPLRAEYVGMSEVLIGLTASSYFAGFIVGCLCVPHLIARVGHIRGFSILAAIMISAILCLDISGSWQIWLVLRFLSGAAVSGLYAVIESWLNSQATTDTRGRILAIYTIITLLGMMVGQFLIGVGPVETARPFTVVAVFLSLAILPVGLTRKIAPEPIARTTVRLRRLYEISHSAFAGALLAGVVIGSFWSLGAVFARHYGESSLDVAWFMSTAIGGGLVMQYPIGWLSDRVDRRHILVLLCFSSALSSLAVGETAGQSWQLLAVFLFGASAMSLYSVALATAADVSSREEFVEMGTAVLMVNAIGAVIAPLPLARVMAVFGPAGLFGAFAVLCFLFTVYIGVRSRVPRAISAEDQTPFAAVSSASAPPGFALDPRGDEGEDQELNGDDSRCAAQ